jgi:hypothetical protein
MNYERTEEASIENDDVSNAAVTRKLEFSPLWANHRGDDSKSVTVEELSSFYISPVTLTTDGCSIRGGGGSSAPLSSLPSLPIGGGGMSLGGGGESVTNISALSFIEAPWTLTSACVAMNTTTTTTDITSTATEEKQRMPTNYATSESMLMDTTMKNDVVMDIDDTAVNESAAHHEMAISMQANEDQNVSNNTTENAPTDKREEGEDAEKEEENEDDEEENKYADIPFQVGLKVEVNYWGRGRFYPGTITKVRDNGTCDILYDDGGDENRVKPHLIRVLMDQANAWKDETTGGENNQRKSSRKRKPTEFFDISADMEKKHRDHDEDDGFDDGDEEYYRSGAIEEGEDWDPFGGAAGRKRGKQQRRKKRFDENGMEILEEDHEGIEARILPPEIQAKVNKNKDRVTELVMDLMSFEK